MADEDNVARPCPHCRKFQQRAVNAELAQRCAEEAVRSEMEMRARLRHKCGGRDDETFEKFVERLFEEAEGRKG